MAINYLSGEREREKLWWSYRVAWYHVPCCGGAGDYHDYGWVAGVLYIYIYVYILPRPTWLVLQWLAIETKGAECILIALGYEYSGVLPLLVIRVQNVALDYECSNLTSG